MFISYHSTDPPGSDLTDTMQEDMSTKKTKLSTVSSTEAQHLQGMVVATLCIGIAMVFVFTPHTLENAVLTFTYK